MAAENDKGQEPQHPGMKRAVQTHLLGADVTPFLPPASTQEDRTGFVRFFKRSKDSGLEYEISLVWNVDN